MRSKILITLAALAFAALALVGNFHQRELTSFPDNKAFIALIQERAPETFWQRLATAAGKGDLNNALIYSALRRFEVVIPSLSSDDRTSIDAAKGTLFFKLKNYEQAAISLRHVIATSHSETETAQCVELLTRIYETTGNHEGLAQIKKQLSARTLKLQNNDVEPVIPDKAAQTQPGTSVFFIILWILLLLFPAAVTNIEKHAWLKRYSERADQRGPFIAFVYSPMCNILLSTSAILLLLLAVLRQLGITSTFMFLSLHLLVSWFFCQIPLHHIESLVKKNSTGLFSYCREQLSLAAITHQSLIAGIITIILLHNMVTWLPIWPISRPLGAAVAPPVFFATILLLIQLVLPRILLLRRISSTELGFPMQQRIVAANSGYRQGIVETGALSFSATSIIFGGMQNHLAAENLQLLLERSGRKFSSQAVFNDFLLTLTFVAGISILPAVNPIFWARLFGSGPYFIEALALLSATAFCGIIRRTLERRQQKEIDAGFATDSRADKLLSSLEIINKLNFFPDNMREGEHSEFDPLSLDESRISLRAAAGRYLPATSRPDGLVLVSLWRGRLAVDWKLGREEAVFLTSLDYQVTASDNETELCALAARHNRLGAECIYQARQQQLKIVFCSQKFSAFTAETPLPQDKICQICSEAMHKATNFGPYKWESTPEGCLLSAEADSPGRRIV